ncbi:hypothetical protein DMI70_01725 [Escherichia coli]|nr:hypothetical protein [Escherichia coli]
MLMSKNEQAVGFYKKVGFKVTDALRWTIWKPYPLLNLAYVGCRRFSHPGGLNFGFVPTNGDMIISA